MKFRSLILILMGMGATVCAQASTVSDRMAAVRRGDRITPAWEAEAILATHGAVGRKDFRLTVRLDSGKNLFFVDTLEACDSTPSGIVRCTNS